MRNVSASKLFQLRICAWLVLLSYLFPRVSFSSEALLTLIYLWWYATKLTLWSCWVLVTKFFIFDLLWSVIHAWFQFSKEDYKYYVWTATADLHLQPLLSTWALVQKLSNGNHARCADALLRYSVAAWVCYSLLLESIIYKLLVIRFISNYSFSRRVCSIFIERVRLCKFWSYIFLSVYMIVMFLHCCKMSSYGYCSRVAFRLTEPYWSHPRQRCFICWVFEINPELNPICVRSPDTCWRLLKNFQNYSRLRLSQYDTISLTTVL